MLISIARRYRVCGWHRRDHAAEVLCSFLSSGCSFDSVGLSLRLSGKEILRPGCCGAPSERTFSACHSIEAADRLAQQREINVGVDRMHIATPLCPMNALRTSAITPASTSRELNVCRRS